MINIFNELRNVGVFFISTVEDDKPKVRPFGATCFFNNSIYICTSKTKDVYKQMIKNPNVEIAGVYMGQDEAWLRIQATVVEDNDDGPRTTMMRNNPGLRQIYSLDDGKFVVFRLENVKAYKCHAVGEAEVIS